MRNKHINYMILNSLCTIFTNPSIRLVNNTGLSYIEACPVFGSITSSELLMSS
jgi:hypothetical protein